MAEKQFESVPMLKNFDELLEHLKTSHNLTNWKISEWLDEYTSKHPAMDFRDHLWYMHQTNHYQWDGINHIHEKGKDA